MIELYWEIGKQILQQQKEEGWGTKVIAQLSKDLKKSFSPEFLNRLDSTVVFHPLNREAIKKIIKIQLEEFQLRLKDRNIRLKIGGSTINAFAKKSYNPEFGAREVRRTLAHSLENSLTESIINGSVVNNNTYKVVFDSKTNICNFEKIID